MVANERSKMRFRVVSAVLAIVMAVSLSGCSTSTNDSDVSEPNYNTMTMDLNTQDTSGDEPVEPVEPTDEPVNPSDYEEIEAPVEPPDLSYVVMVGGVLYYSTGIVSNEPRCGVMDGVIDSYVYRNETPTVDNQSNFGAGYGYQYGAEASTIEVCINDEWIIFRSEGAQSEDLSVSDLPDIEELSEENSVGFYGLVIGSTVREDGKGTLYICGLSINDQNHRTLFYVGINSDTEIKSGGEVISLSDISACDVVAITYGGEVMESYPGQISPAYTVDVMGHIYDADAIYAVIDLTYEDISESFTMWNVQ